MSVDRAEQKAGAPLGHPHITLELAPSADGSTFRDWQTSTSFVSTNTLVDEADIAAFHGSAHIYFLDRLVLVRSQASHPTRMVRQGVDIARSDVDLLQICLLTEGEITGQCGDRTVHAGPGDITFIDCSQPFVCELSGFDMLVLLVPRDGLPEALSAYLVHGMVLGGDRPATRILAQLLADTYRQAPNLTLHEAEASARAVVTLANGLCQEGLSPRRDPSPTTIDLFTSAQAAIERMLEDADLSAAVLQKSLRISRATLYDLFAPHGGVQAYIRERRLQRCYEIFKSNQRPGETIGAVAFSLGFRSEAHFSRAFKDRFGLSPRTLRMESRGRSGDVQPATVSGIAPHMIQTLVRGEAK